MLVIGGLGRDKDMETVEGWGYAVMMKREKGKGGEADRGGNERKGRCGRSREGDIYIERER